MLQTNITVESNTDQELVEAVATLHQTTLADDQLSCQVCNESINEGDEVICHLQSPAEQDCYEITQTRCIDHDDLTGLLTLGVDELVVDGRVGQCRDHATQQTWPVLLAPSVRLISAPDTTSGRVVSNDDLSSSDSGQSRIPGRNSDTLTASGDTQSVLSHADRDGSAATSEPRSAGSANNE